MDSKLPGVDPVLPRTHGQKPGSVANGKDDLAARRRTSEQFEAIFIQQLFQGMRATVPTGNLLESDRSVEVFQDLMDRQLAEEMARRQGVGIADLMLRALQDKESKAEAPPLPSPLPLRGEGI